MWSARNTRSQQLIQKKQADQQKVIALQAKLKQEFHQQEFAKWQNKGQEISINQQVKQKLAALRQQSRINLQIRRQQLAELLESDDRKHRQYIVSLQQTPQQTRQRMAQRVSELKEQKQQRRQEEVSQKLQKRFQLNADELRKVDQQIKEMKIAAERNIQLVQKQALMQQQYQEQLLFAQLNQRDLKKKEAAEKAKVLEQQERVNQRNAIVAIQQELKKRKEEEQVKVSQQEKHMLRQAWREQNREAEMRQTFLREKKKQINEAIQIENEKIKRERELKEAEEKQRDRQMIERIVAKERQLVEYEKLLKEKQRQEAQKIRAGVKDRHKDSLAYEKQLDLLIEQERLKQERKKQEQWQKRENARVNLLYHVYEDRERKVNENKAERQQIVREREEDKVEVERRLKEYESEQRRKQQIEMSRNKQQQGQLLSQIAQKEEKRRLLLMELQQQEEQQRVARQEYDRKIQSRKEKGRAELEQFRKTNRIF